MRLLLSLGLALVFAGCASEPRSTLQPISIETPPKPIGVYDVAEVDVPPRTNSPLLIDYPPALLSARISGRARVLFTVLPTGALRDVITLETNDARFGDALRRAVAKLQYAPARKDGRPVACRITYELTFKADG